MKIELKQPQAIYELGQRDNQEDYIWPLKGKATEDNFFFILCDGMGGHEHGEVASRIVAQTIAQYLQDHANPDEIVQDDVLYAALDAAYQELDRADDMASKKMGTTLCLILFHHGGLTAMHIGDSRIYHLRPSARKLIYQSKDHSLVYDLYQAGEITYEEIATSPQKNIITRAMQPGVDNRCKPSIVHITDLRPGDYLYMCSDGMVEQMDNRQLCQLFSSSESDEAKRDKLIEATRNNKDNHSAYFMAISRVASGPGDESLLDDEQSSKDNALNILPVYNAQDVQEDEEDVMVVHEGKRQTASTTDTTKSSKKRLVLGAVIVIILFVCAYLFFVPKKDKPIKSPTPSGVKIGESPSNDQVSPPNKANTDESRMQKPSGNPRQKAKEQKKVEPSNSDKLEKDKANKDKEAEAEEKQIIVSTESEKRSKYPETTKKQEQNPLMKKMKERNNSSTPQQNSPKQEHRKEGSSV